MYDKRVQWIYTSIDTLLSIVRIIILTHFKKTKQIQKKHDKCFLFGNGPSLLTAIQKYESTFSDYDLIAVNQMAVTDLFEKYKPSIYILADPAYWYEEGYEDLFYQADELFEALTEKTNWELQLYMPYQANIQQVIGKLRTNSNIKIVFYNKTTFYGFNKIAYFVYNRQWGMVRPQNILCPALMLLIYSKYQTIYLAGANSDWMKNIWVDEKNQLRLQDEHYYFEEQQNGLVLPCSMDEQCISLYYAFNGYKEIHKYALSKKIKIYNTYKHSFIDAFEKIENLTTEYK